MFGRKNREDSGKLSVSALVHSESTGKRLMTTLGKQNGFKLKVFPGGIFAATPAQAKKPKRPDILIVELDPRRPDEIVELRNRMQRDYAGAPVIVTAETLDAEAIRKLMQMRASDWLPTQTLERDIVQSCERALIPASSGAHTALCLTFLAASGGVGTTTTAITAADILSRPSRNVRKTTCLVDLDFQSGEVADFLDLAPNLQIAEIGSEPDRLDERMLEVMLSPHQSGLSALAAPNGLGDYKAIHPDFVPKLLDLAAARFENIVIDMPRTWRPWSDNVILGSDRIFVMTDTAVPGLRRAKMLLNELEARYEDHIDARVIINRYRKRLFGTAVRKSDIEEMFGDKIAGYICDDPRLVQEAMDRGILISEVKKASRVAKDVAAIVLDKDSRRSR